MKIEILYFEDCPHHRPAVDLAKEVTQDLGIDCVIEEVEIEGPEDAQRHRFLGSPTIRVNGLDIEPNARDRTDYGIACRTYDGAGIPPRAMIESSCRKVSGLIPRKDTGP